MTELKDLIQNYVVKPSIVPEQTERDQTITEELIFSNKMESMHKAYTAPHHIITDKGKGPERAHSPLNMPPSSPYHPISSTSKVNPIMPLTIQYPHPPIQFYTPHQPSHKQLP